MPESHARSKAGVELTEDVLNRTAAEAEAKKTSTVRSSAGDLGARHGLGSGRVVSGEARARELSTSAPRRTT
jgi:hypothetical protein